MGVGEMVRESKGSKLPVIKINKSWGCNVQHGDYSQEYRRVYLKVAKRIDFKSSHHAHSHTHTKL